MDFKDLLAYKKSFSLAMKIFEVSKNFPKEEKYSLTNQIKRLSRSVTANISETIEVGKLLNYMINNPNKFGVN